MMINRSWTQARWEFALLMRNGEQLLLLIVIPIVLLLAMRFGPQMLVDALPPESVIPTVASVSVMAGCFTSLAIATAFERRSGALRFMATTPLRVRELLAGKLLAAAGVTGVSLAVVVVVGVLLGWPLGTLSGTAIIGLVVTVILGCLAWAALALLVAGALRAEAVLALANGVFVLALVFGGILNPTDRMGALGDVIRFTPSAALANGLREPGITSLVILIVWTAVAGTLASMTFRWEDR